MKKFLFAVGVIALFASGAEARQYRFPALHGGKTSSEQCDTVTVTAPTAPAPVVTVQATAPSPAASPCANGRCPTSGGTTTSFQPFGGFFQRLVK